MPSYYILLTNANIIQKKRKQVQQKYKTLFGNPISTLLYFTLLHFVPSLPRYPSSKISNIKKQKRRARQMFKFPLSCQKEEKIKYHHLQRYHIVQTSCGTLIRVKSSISTDKSVTAARLPACLPACLPARLQPIIVQLEPCCHHILFRPTAAHHSGGMSSRRARVRTMCCMPAMSSSL